MTEYTTDIDLYIDKLREQYQQYPPPHEAVQIAKEAMACMRARLEALEKFVKDAEPEFECERCKALGE